MQLTLDEMSIDSLTASLEGDIDLSIGDHQVEIDVADLGLDERNIDVDDIEITVSDSLLLDLLADRIANKESELTMEDVRDVFGL